MLQDANSAEIPSALSTDICIVGGGAAGITLGVQLARRKRPFLLIESGDEHFDPAQQRLYSMAVTGLPYAPDASRLRFFGGTTNHWAGWCRQIDPVDVQPAEGLERMAWPISIEELAPYYEIAHDYCRIGPNESGARQWVPRLEIPGDRKSTLTVIDNAEIESRIWQYSDPPVRFGSAFREELMRSSDARILLNLNLVSATLRDREIAALQCRTLKGKDVTIACRTVIICCGGIENARILLTLNREGSRQPGNDHDLVGRYFADHVIPNTAADVIPTTGDFSFYSKQWNTNYAATNRRAGERREVRALFGLSQGAIRNLKVPNVTARLEPPVPLDPADADLMTIARFAAQYDAERTGRPTRSTFERMELVIAVSHHPEWSSRVYITPDERDPLGVPKAALNWVVNERDVETIRIFVERLGAVLAEKNLGRVRWRLKESLADLVRRGAWIGNHHIGTTGMGADVRSGVVDSNLRVFGMENLYVCGSSVFPHATTSTPTLTIVALAARLASHLTA